jgi:transposase-like protein
VGEKRREEKERREEKKRREEGKRGRSKGEVPVENEVVATINQLIKLTLFLLRHCPCTVHVFKVPISDMVPKKTNHPPKKVSTPGSYRLPSNSTTPVKKTPVKNKKVKGRPIAKKNIRKTRQKVQLRATYTEEDLLEAIRLVKEEDKSICAAAKHINSVKLNPVPRHGGHKNSTVQVVLIWYPNLFILEKGSYNFM